MSQVRRLSTLLFFAATVAFVSPTLLQAQKPALVKSIDEPGRTPYLNTMSFQQTPSNCINNSACQVTFPVVPQGFRLVITHVNATFAAKNYGFAHIILYQNNPGTSTMSFPATVLGVDPSGYASLIADWAVRFYIEPGASPEITIYANNLVPAFGTADVTIAGYLVAIP